MRSVRILGSMCDLADARGKSEGNRDLEGMDVMIGNIIDDKAVRIRSDMKSMILIPGNILADVSIPSRR